MRCIRGGGLRTFLSSLLVCSTVLLTRPALAQDRQAPAAPAILFKQDPVSLVDALSSVLAKAIFGPYVIFSDFGLDTFDILKDIYDSSPIGLKLQGTLPLANLAAYDGHPSSDGVGFVVLNTSTRVPEYVFFGFSRFFVGTTRTVDLTRFPLTGVDASQGLSVVGDYFGNFVIVSFKEQAAYVHFAFMTVGQFLRQTLPGIPVHAFWTQAGVYVLYRNSNGLAFVPKQGFVSMRTLPFTPNKGIYAPNGDFFISDAVAPVIHELRPDYSEVTQYTVRSQAYALNFLTATLLLYVLLPNVFGVLDLTSRLETDYTFQPANRQIIDYWLRPGYFPPRLMVDSFDPVLQKGFVDQLTISGLDFDVHHGILPRSRMNPYTQWAPDAHAEPRQ